jgi:hypothetical protein
MIVVNAIPRQRSIKSTKADVKGDHENIRLLGFWIRSAKDFLAPQALTCLILVGVPPKDKVRHQLAEEWDRYVLSISVLTNSLPKVHVMSSA